MTRLSLLDLKENQIEDLGPLKAQTELKMLFLEQNKIRDLSPLVEMAKADAAARSAWPPFLRLYLAGNPLSDDAKSSQIDALKAMGVRIEG